jgi:hypothetical protein
MPGGSEDVSTIAEYSSVIGRRADIIAAVDGYGIRRHVGESQLLYVTLIPTTISVSGPEIAFRRRVPIGTSLTVVAVKKRRPLFDSEFYCVVSLNNDVLPVDTEIRLELTRGNESSALGILNPKVYKWRDN